MTALCVLMGALLVVTAHEEEIEDFDDQVDEGHKFLRSDGTEIYGDPEPNPQYYYGGYRPYGVYGGFYGGYRPYGGFYGAYRPYGGFYGGYGRRFYDDDENDDAIERSADDAEDDSASATETNPTTDDPIRPESAESLVNAKLGLRIRVRGRIELSSGYVFGRPSTFGTSILMRRRPCVLGPMVNKDGRRYKPLCLIGKHGLVCYGKPRC